MKKLLLAAATSSAFAQSGVVIQQTSGTIVDSTQVWANFSLGGPNGFFTQRGQSHAISDTGEFSEEQWGIADYATQGSLIGQKLVSLGGDSQRATVRGWLEKVVIGTDGRAFGTEEGEYHMGGQGAFEGNAEVILLAHTFAAHTGDAAVFTTVPERLVCFTPATGGAPQPVGRNNFPASLCQQQPATILYNQDSQAPLFSEWPIPATLVHAGSEVICANGKATTQTVVVPQSFSSLSIALVAQSNGNIWPSHVWLVNAQTGATVYSMGLTDSNALQSWVQITPPSPQPAGTYTIMLSMDSSPTIESFKPGQGSRAERHKPLKSQGYSGTAPGWVTNPYPSNTTSSAGSVVLGAGQLVFTNDTSTFAYSNVRTWSLAQKLARAMQWQLDLSLGGTDILLITDPLYAGTATHGLNSGSSYYDLFRMGWAASYINMRYLESLIAYADLQSAGLIPSTCGPSDGPWCIPAAVINATIPQIKYAIEYRFGIAGSGSFIDWAGCGCTGVVNGSTVLSCSRDDLVNGSVSPSASCSNVQIVDIEFLPGQALAVKLGLTPLGSAFGTVIDTFQAMINAMRIEPGYRTNNIGFEDAGTAYWLAYDRWADIDAQGFAVREWNQTGDWMLFPPSDHGDGNGNFGLQEENGGVLLSTTVFVQEAAANGAAVNIPMFEVWAATVSAMSGIGTQLAAKDSTYPLLPNDRAALRVPMESTLVSYLCAVPRGPSANTTDPWGGTECSYYKSVTYALPENGLLVYNIVRGLLQLNINAAGQLSVSGVALTVPSASTVPMPPAFDSSIASITVNGLNVGAQRNVTLVATVQQSQITVKTTIAQ